MGGVVFVENILLFDIILYAKLITKFKNVRLPEVALFKGGR